MPYFFSVKKKEWTLVRDYEFSLPSRTLVYGEIVSVFSADHDHREELFTIIDGFILAGENINNLLYAQRYF